MHSMQTATGRADSIITGRKGEGKYAEKERLRIMSAGSVNLLPDAIGVNGDDRRGKMAYMILVCFWQTVGNGGAQSHRD